MTNFFPPIERPDTGELRKFGLISGTIVAVLFGIGLPWIFNSQWPLWPWIFAAVFWAWGVLLPDTLFVVYKYWLKFGHVAGWVNTRIILGILFYLVFCPVGVVLKIMRKDPMNRKLVGSDKSYRVISNDIKRSHIERPY